MSQENVDVVRGVFENVNARDFPAVMDAYAEEVVLALHGGVAFASGDGTAGKEAVGEWFGDWFRVFDSEYRFEIHEVRDFGDRVLIAATHHGRGRSSGVPITQFSAWIFVVRDSKVVRLEAYLDLEEALEAVGQAE